MRSTARSIGRSSQPRGALKYALLAAAICAAFLIGRASMPSAGAPADSPRRSSSEGDRQSPADFARTPSGAAEAVAAYQRSFASTSILGPGALQQRIEAVATPAYVSTMLAANSPGTQRIAAGAIGQGLAKGLQTLYAAVPIGYQIESFSPERARVLTWGFTLLGNAATVEPAAYFGLTHTELAWSEDGWRIAETRSGFGPTPKLGTEPGPLGSFSVMKVAPRLKGYELAP
jgi:hypothetical protein